MPIRSAPACCHIQHFLVAQCGSFSSTPAVGAKFPGQHTVPMAGEHGNHGFIYGGTMTMGHQDHCSIARRDGESAQSDPILGGQPDLLEGETLCAQQVTPCYQTRRPQIGLEQGVGPQGQDERNHQGGDQNRPQEHPADPAPPLGRRTLHLLSCSHSCFITRASSSRIGLSHKIRPPQPNAFNTRNRPFQFRSASARGR